MNTEKLPLRQLLDLDELSKLWKLPKTWLQERCRDRAKDPIPCFRLGRYVRFDPTDPDLLAWLDRQRSKKAPRKSLL